MNLNHFLGSMTTSAPVFSTDEIEEEQVLYNRPPPLPVVYTPPQIPSISTLIASLTGYSSSPTPLAIHQCRNGGSSELHSWTAQLHTHRAFRTVDSLSSSTPCITTMLGSMQLISGTGCSTTQSANMPPLCHRHKLTSSGHLIHPKLSRQSST
jgi:hypothetical protein